MLVESLALIRDSGGAGRHRGGLGVERVVQALTEFNVNTSIERAVLSAVGPRRRSRGHRQRNAVAP